MVGARPYVCQECDREVSPGAYRAECPDCGGRLERAPSNGG